MDVILNQISELTGLEKSTSFQIFVGFLTIFVSLLILLIFSNRKSSKKSIFITGISDSGKSALFFRLINPKSSQKSEPFTVTSQIANIFDDFKPRKAKKNQILRLIDIPGSDKVRSSIFTGSLKKYNPISGLIYVLDSGAVVKDCREVAQYLYELLADGPGVAQKRNLPILVVCNKQDSLKSKSAKVVKSILEKEFTLLNQTRSAALQQIDSNFGGPGSKDVKKSILGKIGVDFKFEHLPQKFEFVESTAVDNKEIDKKADISAVEQWLAEI